MYMFSDEWEKVVGASKITDDELKLILNAEDEEALAKVNEARRVEQEKKEQEEKQRRRE